MNDLASRHREWRSQRCVVGQGHAERHESDGHGELAALRPSIGRHSKDKRGCTEHRLEGEYGMSCYPGEIEGTDAGPRAWVFWSMVTVAIMLMAYGFYLGNPFETYYNGSTL